jgi:putative nucleotidyltransferase with HDIG domain
MSYFHSPTFKDQDKTRSSLIIFGILWTIIIAVTLRETIDLALFPENTLRWLSIILIVDISCMILLRLNKKGLSKLCGILLTLILWALFIVLLVTGKGLNDSTTPAFLIVIAFSGIVLGRNGIWITCLCFIFTVTILSLLEASKGSLTRLFFPEMFSTLMDYVFYAVIIAVVTNLDLRSTRKAYINLATETIEREKTEHALQDNEVFTNQLIDAIETIVIVLDSIGNVILFNRGAEAITDYSWSEINNKKDFGKLFKNDIPYFFINTDSDEDGLFFEGPIITKSGYEKCIYWNKTKIIIKNNALAYIFTGFNVTEKKLHEHRLERITSVSSALRQAQTHEEITHIVLEQIGKLFNTKFVSILFPENYGKYVVVSNLNIGFQKMIEKMISRDKDLSAVFGIDTYLDNNFNYDYLSLDFPEILNSHSLLCTPLVVREQRIGYLLISRNEIIEFEDRKAFEAIADIASNAIYRSTTFEKMKEDVQRLDALHKIDLALSVHLDGSLIVDTLFQQLDNSLKPKAIYFYLLDNELKILHLLKNKGAAIHFDDHLLIGKSLAGTAVLLKSAIQIADLSLNEEIEENKFNIQKEDRTTYYGFPLIANNKVRGVLELFFTLNNQLDKDWQKFIQIICDQVAIALDDVDLVENLKEINQELALAYDMTIEGWSHALDLRDKETEGHSKRVTDLAIQLARAVGVDDIDLIQIKRGSLLHDIGKMGVPDGILLKPGPLSDEERQIMQRHPQYAYEMLCSIDYLKKAIEIPFCHHENWDGTGYPRKLKGVEIPLSARIFSIVDVWDAITSDRPYRLAWSKDKAINYLRENAGKQFDPQIIKVFFRMIKKS